MNSRHIAFLKVALFPGLLAPVAFLLWNAFHNNLGANPVEAITHTTGDWTLRLILATLAITPLRRLTGLGWLIRFRRMTGLFAFFYGCLHLMTYVWLDQGFDIHSMMKDVGKRPFITAGFSAFVLLVPLAMTSTAGWIRRLGGRRWNLLHRLIYASAALGVVHYLWLVKADISRPIRYGIVLGTLLAYRLAVWAMRLRRPQASPQASTAAAD